MGELTVERSYTILIDKRERKPLVFPRHIVMLDPSKPPGHQKPVTVALTAEPARLTTGDYQLKGFEHKVIVERKGSLDEIAMNTVTGDRARFIAELDRLVAECERPVLMLEGTPLSLQTSTKQTIQPGLGVDGLQRLLYQYGIPLLMLPTTTSSMRLKAGEWVARLLINGAIS